MLRLIDWLSGVMSAGTGVAMLLAAGFQTLESGFVDGVMLLPARPAPETVDAVTITLVLVWAASSAWAGLRIALDRASQ